jgi:endo-1,4-beta-xylanase
MGNAFEQLETGSVTSVTISSDGDGNTPRSTERVITYRVQFPIAGEYELYARVRVGEGDTSDDSFFFGRDFGELNVAVREQWALVNGLGRAGQHEPNALVTRGGSPRAHDYNWLNVSAFASPLSPLIFTVPEGQLTQTFQIGAREDGLDIDRLAFGPRGITHTVSQLEQQQPGRFIPPKPPPPPFTPQGPPLAHGLTKYLGGVYSAPQLPNLTAYFNQVTPENAGKWGSVEATRDVMSFEELDAAYALAKQHGMLFRMHVMVWGNQQPEWIESLSPADQRAEIEEWFQAVSQRYPALDFIEIVNEPLHDPPSNADDGGGHYIEALGGSGETGWDWVLESFRLGRRYFPQTRLMINEFGIVGSPKDAERYKGIIDLLKREGLIDAIGVQCHSFSTTGETRVITDNLNLLASTGLPLYVTELDIDGVEDSTQLAEFQRIFPALWEHPAVQGITLWGYRPGMWRTAQGANLAYTNGAERPALAWLRQYLTGPGRMSATTAPAAAPRASAPAPETAAEWRPRRRKVPQRLLK